MDAVLGWDLGVALGRELADQLAWVLDKVWGGELVRVLVAWFPQM